MQPMRIPDNNTPANTPDITAIIVTYRSNLAQVADAVTSFYAGDDTLHRTLLVVDNASGAEYHTALRNCVDTASNAKARVILAPRNGGFGYGNNLALCMLRAFPEYCGRYILLLNPDVAVHSHTLSTLMHYMDSASHVAATSPRVFFPDGGDQPLNKRHPRVIDLFLRRFCPAQLRKWPPIARQLAHYEMQDMGYTSPCEVEFMTGCFMFIRSSALWQCGLFDERFFLYLEDADLSRRLAVYGRLEYRPEASITHHWQRGSHKKWRLMLVMLHSMWVYFNKWGWRLW